MKKTTVVLIVIGLLASSFLLVTCDKKSSTGPEDLFTGFWNSSTASLALFLTTNSAQQATNMLAQGTGAINITGLYNTDLSWIVGFGDPALMGFLATNQSILQFLLLPIFPAYNLLIADVPLALYIATFVAIPTPADSLEYFGDADDFAYDRPTHTLTADNAQFFDETGTPAVTANGTVTLATIDVPANSPTNALRDLAALPIPGIGVLEMAEDGTFALTVTLGEEEETLTGTWEDLGDNQLQISVVIEEGEDPETVVLDYTVDAQTLTITYEEDVCALLQELLPANCEQLIEILFGLDPGSLDSTTARLVLNFTKAAQKGAVSPYLERWKPSEETLLRFFFRRLFLNAASLLGM